MFAKRLCYAGLAVYLALNLTDFVQTYVLIWGTAGDVYEANPVAAAFLDLFGWNGLAVYKLGVVAMFASAVYMLSRLRPATGAGVVILGCLSVASVTLYSHQLVSAAQIQHPDDITRFQRY